MNFRNDVRCQEIADFEGFSRNGSRAMIARFVGHGIGYFTVYVCIAVVHVYCFHVVPVPQQMRQPVCQHRNERAARNADVDQ